MPYFIKRLGLFFFPLIFFFTLVEILLREIPNDYSYKNFYLDNHAKEIEVLILGSSHTYRSIIPDRIDLKSFNLSYISQSLDLDFLIFDKFKKDLVNLKYLIVNISYPSLFSSLQTSTEKWRLKNYNIYYNLNITCDVKNYSEILSNNYSVNASKIIQYYIHGKSQISCSKLGAGNISDNRELFQDAIKAVQRHTDEKYIGYIGYLNELDKLISYSKSSDFNIVFLTPPAFEEYNRLMNENQIELMNNALDSITILHSNVFRLNLLLDSSYLEEDFLNADHLNTKGAIKLTYQVNEFIKGLQ